MSNAVLIKNLKAEAATPAFTVVKFGAADGAVLPAAAVADKLFGVSTDVAALLGERCDVIVSGLADVLFGGVVTRGDLLTTDALGRAVTAVPAAGVNNRIIGTAFVSGVLGDVGAVLISLASAQG
jgi:hypothetical protein